MMTPGDRGDPLHADQVRDLQRDQEGEPPVDELADQEQAQDEREMRQAEEISKREMAAGAAPPPLPGRAFPL